jgi:DHA2 family methylenomycin A resistance protein-like MFS transporter
MEKRIGMITAATSLGFVVVQLDGSILSLALPTIGAALGARLDALQWTVDAYFLAGRCWCLARWR